MTACGGRSRRVILKSTTTAARRRCVCGGRGDSAAATAGLRPTACDGRSHRLFSLSTAAADCGRVVSGCDAAAPLTSLLKIAVRYAFVTEGPHACLKFNHCVVKISTVSTANSSYYRVNHTQPCVFTLRVDFDSKLQLRRSCHLFL